jgi:energy-converting hydrogenase Eha subunit A
VKPEPTEDTLWKQSPYTGINKENEMNRSLLRTIFNGVALAMGIAVIVLNLLGTLTTETAITLLSIGVAALGMAGLQKE